jgi:hypothetical protein
MASASSTMSKVAMLVAIALAADEHSALAATTCALSNTLGSNAVLQRSPGVATLFGVAPAGTRVNTTAKGLVFELSTVADASGVSVCVRVLHG